jgi:hypothetical protein
VPPDHGVRLTLGARHRARQHLWPVRPQPAWRHDAYVRLTATDV